MCVHWFSPLLGHRVISERCNVRSISIISVTFEEMITSALENDPSGISLRIRRIKTDES